MFVGMTSRGWAATGKKEYGLQRLVWNGRTPFEIKSIKAQDDGFILEFTKPVDKYLAETPSTYQLTSFNYKYHNSYGSPIIDQQKGSVENVEVSDDRLSVTIKAHGMRLGYIHQIKIPDLRARSGERLLHNTAYYTLNTVPGGVLNSPPTEKNGICIKRGSTRKKSK